MIYLWFGYCSVLISAFVGCAIAFGCFSMAAMVARRREFLYLGALLSSGVSILFWLHFASSLFGGSTAIFKFEVCHIVLSTVVVGHLCSHAWINYVVSQCHLIFIILILFRLNMDVPLDVANFCHMSSCSFGGCKTCIYWLIDNCSVRCCWFE